MCKQCRVVPEKKTLAYKRPDLIKEWDCEKNGDLTPHNVRANNREKAWWKCSQNHKCETDRTYK